MKVVLFMFKTETHLHVSEVSPCSNITASDMVMHYYKAGYKTLFISDHFSKKYFDSLGEISWEDKIKKFLTGYEFAKKTGEKVGINVLLSAEIEFTNSCNHYLLYGIDEAFLKSRPDVLEMTIETFYSYAKQHGVTVVQSHPFRDNSCNPTQDFVDGFEVHNSNPRHENYTDLAEAQAKEHNLYMTAGSDAHRLDDYALSGMISENEIKTMDEFIELVKSSLP